MTPLHAAPFTVDIALPADIPVLDAMIPGAVRALSQGFYTTEQIESAIRFVFGVDTQLVTDRTYFIVRSGTHIAGCGGWSKRRILYGADKMKTDADPLLDPGVDAARIRAFFVSPGFARQGVGSMLLERCVDGARAEGFRALELAATLPGQPLYARHGFEPLETVAKPLPDGVIVPFVLMRRVIE